MVNSDIPAGTYAIRPIDGPQDHYLNIRPYVPIEPPPDVLVDLGSHRFPWVLKDTNTHTSTVHAQRFKWFIPKDLALAVSAVKKAAELIFRRDGTGFVTIDVPVNGIVSRRLTFHINAPPSQDPFTFQEANNSRAQLFEVIRIFDP